MKLYYDGKPVDLTPEQEEVRCWQGKARQGKLEREADWLIHLLTTGCDYRTNRSLLSTQLCLWMARRCEMFCVCNRPACIKVCLTILTLHIRM